MTELLLRDVDEHVLHDLRKYADEHGTTTEEEAKRILNRAIERKRNMNDFIHEANTFARRVGPQTIDSTEMIREDRENLG